MNDLIKVLTAAQKEVHELARAKGWYAPPKSPVESLMMVVTELAEAVDEIRNDTKPIYYVGDKPEGEAIELADAVIRILDYCQSRGFNLGQAIQIKHAYNQTRPHRHGGKKV